MLDHAQAEIVLAAALRGQDTEPDPNSVLVGLALYDDDREFVEAWCVRIAEDAPDRSLGGLACLCIGHLARRFREISPRAELLVRTMAEDPAMVAANAQVLDARGDVDQFIGKQ